MGQREQLTIIDEVLGSTRYRRSFHRDEAQGLVEPLGVTMEWHREYMTIREFQDYLLDLRLERMEREEDGQRLPEGADALVGADIGAG
jgi:hypothetical protein